MVEAPIEVLLDYALYSGLAIGFVGGYVLVMFATSLGNYIQERRGSP